MPAVKAAAPAIKGKLSEGGRCVPTLICQLMGQLAPSAQRLEVRGKLAIWLRTHPRTAGHCAPACAEVAFSLLNRREQHPQRSFKVHTNENGGETEEDGEDK